MKYKSQSHAFRHRQRAARVVEKFENPFSHARTVASDGINERAINEWTINSAKNGR